MQQSHLRGKISLLTAGQRDGYTRNFGHSRKNYRTKSYGYKHYKTKTLRTHRTGTAERLARIRRRKQQ